MKSYKDFENLSTSERTARFGVSVLVIVTAMLSPIAGTTLYAVINLLAIGLATTAISGWDPAKSLTLRNKSTVSRKHGHHA